MFFNSERGHGKNHIIQKLACSGQCLRFILHLQPLKREEAAFPLAQECR
jgi:hypothetical protein